MPVSLICVFILLSFSLSQAKAKQEIVGRWEAVETTTKGGLGDTLEFNRDGSVTFTFGPLLHGTYKLEGSHLTTNTVHSDGSQTTQIQDIEIQGDTLVESGDMYDRLTSRDADSSPIVGRWREKIPVTMYDFRRDGSLFIVEESGSALGYRPDMTYKLEGNLLTITVLRPGTNERITRTSKVRFEADSFIEKDSDGREYRRRRLNQNEPDKSPIVGKWIIEIPEGTDKRMPIIEYKKNGEWVFRMSLTTSKGRYSVNGDMLTTTLDMETKISRFRFENGFLLLKSPPDRGAEDRFKRIEQ